MKARRHPRGKRVDGIVRDGARPLDLQRRNLQQSLGNLSRQLVDGDRESVLARRDHGRAQEAGVLHLDELGVDVGPWGVHKGDALLHG